MITAKMIKELNSKGGRISTKGGGFFIIPDPRIARRRASSNKNSPNDEIGPLKLEDDVLIFRTEVGVRYIPVESIDYIEIYHRHMYS